MDLPATEAHQVSSLPLDVGSLKVSPRGDRLAVSMEVFPDCDTLACTKERLEKPAKEKATGRSYERLFVRHWDLWADGTRAHLFTMPLSASGLGTPVDLAKGFDADTPGKPFGGDEDYSFSPDGTRLVFSARIAGRTEAWSTNFDLYQVPADGSAAPVNLTASNPAWDTQPVFLANGDLAWLAQDRPGFESDRFHIMLREAKSGLVRLAHRRPGIARSRTWAPAATAARWSSAPTRSASAHCSSSTPRAARRARSSATARSRTSASAATACCLRTPAWAHRPTCTRWR